MQYILNGALPTLRRWYLAKEIESFIDASLAGFDWLWC